MGPLNFYFSFIWGRSPKLSPDSQGLSNPQAAVARERPGRHPDPLASHRGPGPLLALGLYSLLLVALVTADLVHFCRSRGRGRGPSRRPPAGSSAARPLQVSAGTH